MIIRTDRPLPREIPMPRSRTITAALLGATLLAAPAAWAEAIDRHFRAPAYACPSGGLLGLSCLRG